jgi:hypothetical protein
MTSFYFLIMYFIVIYLSFKLHILTKMIIRNYFSYICIHTYIHTYVEVLDFLMGYESYQRQRRILVSSRTFVTLVSSLSRLFACKVVDVFSFHLPTHFSLVCHSAFAQIFQRSQPMRQSNTNTYIHAYIGT